MDGNIVFADYRLRKDLNRYFARKDLVRTMLIRKTTSVIGIRIRCLTPIGQEKPVIYQYCLKRRPWSTAILDKNDRHWPVLCIVQEKTVVSQFLCSEWCYLTNIVHEKVVVNQVWEKTVLPPMESPSASAQGWCHPKTFECKVFHLRILPDGFLGAGLGCPAHLAQLRD